MIRGVNRQTIEIRETANQYFERAILFVTPKGALIEEPKLKGEAEKFLQQLSQPPKSNAQKMARRREIRKNRIIRDSILAVFWTLAGMGATFLFQWIF